MAVIVWTNNPENLKTLIYNAVRDGQLETWALRPNTTNQLTHTTGQWDNKAWFTPTTNNENTALLFKINFPANVNLDEVRDIYGIYHGRFVEILVRRFYQHFTDVVASGKPRPYDNITDTVRARLNA